MNKLVQTNTHEQMNQQTNKYVRRTNTYKRIKRAVKQAHTKE